MGIDLETVLHIVELSKLEFREEELRKFKEELGKIIDYMNKIKELSPEELEEKELPPLRLREDTPQSTLKREDALRGAPEVSNNYFVVPKVISQ